MAEHPWCIKHHTFFVMFADNTTGCARCAEEAAREQGSASHGWGPTGPDFGEVRESDEAGSGDWKVQYPVPGPPCPWCHTAHPGNECPTATYCRGCGCHHGVPECPRANWASEVDSKEKEWRADTSHELWNGELTDSGEEGVTVTSWDRECQVQGQGGHRAPGVPMVGPGICAGLARRVVRLVDEEQKLWGGTLTRAVFTRISKSCYREQQVDQAAALEVNASQQSLKPTKCQWAPTNWPQGEVVTVTFKLTSASSPHLGGYHLVLVVADATGFTLADPNLGVVQCAFSNVNGSLASLGLGAILRGLYAHRPGNPQLVEIDGLQTGTLDEFMN